MSPFTLHCVTQRHTKPYNVTQFQAYVMHSVTFTRFRWRDCHDPATRRRATLRWSCSRGSSSFSRQPWKGWRKRWSRQRWELQPRSRSPCSSGSQPGPSPRTINVFQLVSKTVMPLYSIAKVYNGSAFQSDVNIPLDGSSYPRWFFSFFFSIHFPSDWISYLLFLH